jgi:hypothetical protein
MATAPRKARAVLLALLALSAAGAWAAAATFATNGIAVEGPPPFHLARKNEAGQPFEPDKAGLIGSYLVSGTDSDGVPYAGTHVVSVSLAASGALEMEWDNGKIIGVGELVGNVLAIASLSKGRTVILTMTINPDGSLSGKWSRRTDRGYKGTETWKRL